MKQLNAREAAFEMLLRIAKDGAFSSVLLPEYERRVREQDRGLCHRITLGTIRNQILLDRIIALFSSKKLDIEVSIALRIGLYQMLFLDKVPESAAVNESVKLIERAGKRSAKGFVNAVLRRYARERPELFFENELDRISSTYSHPLWLVEKWAAKWGSSEAEKLCAANNEEPELSFRYTLKTTKGLKANLENGAEKADTALLRELAKSGKIYFQDRGSQLVGSAISLKQGEVFLDLCAAPGSKTTQIAMESGKKAGMILAGDLHSARAANLKNNCLRQGANQVFILRYDAEKSLPFAPKSFDAVLIDAPCSGTGTIRHNPEIRFNLRPEDFCQLAIKQGKILQNASELVKDGGMVIYSTCSVEQEENEDVVEKFLEANSRFKKRDPNVPEKYLTKHQYARTIPFRDGMDGFFVASLFADGAN